MVKVKKRNNPEYDLQVKLVDYLLENYPYVVFRSDLGGIRLPPGLAKKVKKLACGSKGQGEKIAYPDFFIAEPRSGWYGLYIELKFKTSYYAIGKNPKMYVLRISDEHITEQADVLRILRDKGYCGEFAGGWANLIHLVDWYLSLPKNVEKINRPCWPFTVFRKTCH